MAIFLSTPGQAARIFQGDSLPRTKDLFVVNFKAIEGPSGEEDWRRKLTFLVRSIDRPQVQPTVEEVNQYNKRRQIHTGLKYNNIRLSLYETRNNLAGRMWVEYNRHYFGDQIHDLDKWRYDATLPEFLKSQARREFGFSPRTNLGNPSTENFFLEALEIYEVEGTDYIKTILINPKIVSYDPEDVDYSQSEVSTVSMSLAYEAVKYDHGGVHRPVLESDFLRRVFCEDEFKARHLGVRSFAAIVDEPLRQRPEPEEDEVVEPTVRRNIEMPDRPQGDPLVRTENTRSGEAEATERTGVYSSDYGATVSTSRGANHQDYDVLAARASTSPFGNDYAADALAASRATQTPATENLTRSRDGISLSSEAVAASNARSSPTTQIGVRETADAVFQSLDGAFSALDEFGADAVEYFNQRSQATGLSPERVVDDARAATGRPTTAAEQARAVADQRAQQAIETELTRDMGLAFAAADSRNIQESGFSRDLAFRAANEAATRSFGDHRVLSRPTDVVSVVDTGTGTPEQDVDRAGGRLVNTGRRLNEYFADRVRELEERYKPR